MKPQPGVSYLSGAVTSCLIYSALEVLYGGFCYIWTLKKANKHIFHKMSTKPRNNGMYMGIKHSFSSLLSSFSCQFGAGRLGDRPWEKHIYYTTIKAVSMALPDQVTHLAVQQYRGEVMAQNL